MQFKGAVCAEGNGIKSEGIMDGLQRNRTDEWSGTDLFIFLCCVSKTGVQQVFTTGTV